ncbi:MAG: hypothetical protein E6J90_50035 [Deltaproteobacteria bacterium]|nr:MAG: hypothetical protein E6J90_50035 [Deltaproteobacteria bacterium]
MFESAELGHEIDKDRYETEVPELRTALLAAQYEVVKKQAFSVVILIAGVDGGGKGDTLNTLNEWMDPRHLQTNAIRPVNEGLEGRPPMWQFWRALPKKGGLAVFVGSWYTAPLLRRVYRETTTAELDQEIDDILRFERMLIDEGTLVLKFWLHLTKAQQRKRFKKLEKDARTAWRVGPTDWKHLAMYKKFQSTAQHLLRSTSTAAAPWLIVEGTDERYRNLTVGTAVLTALRALLDGRPEGRVLRAAPVEASSITRSPRTSTRTSSRACRAGSTWRLATSGSRSARWSRCSRARTPAARAARSGGSPRRSTPASTTSSRSRRRPTRTRRGRTCGGSGVRCRSVAGSQSSIGRGTGACWSSASRSSAASPAGRAHTVRSTPSRSS